VNPKLSRIEKFHGSLCVWLLVYTQHII